MILKNLKPWIRQILPTFQQKLSTLALELVINKYNLILQYVIFIAKRGKMIVRPM